MNTTTEEVLLRASLQDCREKYDKLSKEYLELAAALVAKELAADLSRVLETVKYLRGIAERGSGDRCPEDMTVESFVLGFVKNLEQHIRNQNEQLAAELEKAETRKLALDVAVSSSCVLAADLAAAQATIEQMREALQELYDVETKPAKATLQVVQGPEFHTFLDECEKRAGAARKAAHEALTLTANLDALHEARAEALERADRIFMQMSLDLRDTTLRLAYGAARDVLKNEAAAHRARKQATKEEGK